MRRIISVSTMSLLVAAMGLVVPGCTQHTVEVKPIHLTVDINLKVDRQLDNFFDFEEAIDPADDQDAGDNSGSQTGDQQ